MIKNMADLNAKESVAFMNTLVEYYKHFAYSEDAFVRGLTRLTSKKNAKRMYELIASKEREASIYFEEDEVKGFIIAKYNDNNTATITDVYTGETEYIKVSKKMLLELFRSLATEAKKEGITSIDATAPMNYHYLIDSLETLGFDIKGDNEVEMEYEKKL